MSWSIYLIHVLKFSGTESKGKGAKTEKGHKADAQLEVLNYPVMGVEVRKHGFRDKAPATYKLEKLQGRTACYSTLFIYPTTNFFVWKDNGRFISRNILFCLLLKVPTRHGLH